MAILTDAPHTGEYIVSEANGFRSREEVTVDATVGAMAAGTVLVKSGENYVAAAGVNAEAILYEGIAAGETAKRTITARDSEVNLASLTFADGIAEADKTAAIAALAVNGIVTRKEG